MQKANQTLRVRRASSSARVSTMRWTCSRWNDPLESGPMPERIFIIEFPNADAARRWYRSDEYQAVLKIRLSASHGRVFLIEGTEISAALPVAGLDAASARR